MTPIKSPQIADAGEQAGTSKEERWKRMLHPFVGRPELTPEQAALLRQVFHEIFVEHHDLVWGHLRKERLNSHDADDLVPEIFLALYTYIQESVLPDNVAAMLLTITNHRVLNHKRGRNRDQLDLGLPSSGSLKPTSGFDIDRAMDLHGLVHTILPRLSTDHRDVIENVYINGLSYGEAAEALGIPEGTLKSRLNAAKAAFYALAQPLLPASQRGPR